MNFFRKESQKTKNGRLWVGRRRKSVEIGWRLVAFFELEDFIDGDAEDE